MEPAVCVAVVGPKLEALAWEALVRVLPGIRVVETNQEPAVWFFTGLAAARDVTGAVFIIRSAETVEVLRVASGAVSLVSPDDSRETLECAIHCAARRVPFYSPLLYPVMLTAMQPAHTVVPSPRTADEQSLALSLRELQVARLVSSGLTNVEVATTLHLSAHTVKTHLTRIYGKLGVQGRQDLRARLPEPT